MSDNLIHPMDCMDGRMNTFSGKVFNLFDPNTDQIDIRDIARGLAYKCHFAGQTPYYFSIAEHSVLVLDLMQKYGKNLIEVQPKMQLAALLHDAAEAYVGDMITPLKKQFPAFCALEGRILSVIFHVYGDIPMSYLEAVKKFDTLAKSIEFEKFFNGYSHLDDMLLFYSPDDADKKFLDRFHELEAVWKS